MGKGLGSSKQWHPWPQQANHEQSDDPSVGEPVAARPMVKCVNPIAYYGVGIQPPADQSYQQCIYKPKYYKGFSFII